MGDIRPAQMACPLIYRSLWFIWRKTTKISTVKIHTFVYWLIDYYMLRLRLWTADINGHIVHPPDDMSWRATVEWYWQGKTEELGEKPVPVPLCPPQISHGLTRARTRASANHLSHGICFHCCTNEGIQQWRIIKLSRYYGILSRNMRIDTNHKVSKVTDKKVMIGLWMVGVLETIWRGPKTVRRFCG
jgi:hypothetical protein